MLRVQVAPVLERNPRRGCGVVAVVLGQSRFVGQYGYVVAPDRLCKTTGDALADRCKGCVPNSLLTAKDFAVEVVTMAARLTDRQKKKILADYVQTNNYCATAKINGVSATTVKNLVRANADIVEKCEQKKEENTVDVLAYMDAQRETVCQIIGKGLAVLNDPEKLAEATPSQITTAIGTLIDKWTTMGSAADSGGGGVVLMPEVKTDA